MGSARIAKATIPTTISLRPIDRSTIVVGLRMLRLARVHDRLFQEARADVCVEDVLSDEQIDQLLLFMLNAREVTVCRAMPAVPPPPVFVPR